MTNRANNNVMQPMPVVAPAAVRPEGRRGDDEATD